MVGRLDILQKTVQLSSGKTMPLVGLGTWSLKPPALQPVLERAVELGCRLMDGAAIYENEKQIGEYLQLILENKSRFNVERKDVACRLSAYFLAFPCLQAMEYKALARRCFPSLRANSKTQDLKTDYLDLYLIHWPFSFEDDGKGFSKMDENGVAIIKPVSISETWGAMEELVKRGKVRSIGVSNFTTNHMEQLFEVAKIKPAVNEIELHPFLPQSELLEFCEKNDIKVIAYSSLASGKKPSPLEHPAVVKIASELKMTTAQVLLSWAITRGTVIIPKTSNPGRLEENFDLKMLNAEHMKAIDSIPTRFRSCNPVEFWKHDCFD